MKKTMLMISLVVTLLAALSPAISHLGSANTSDVEIVSAETGRIFFDTWWPINKFAKSLQNPDVDSFIEVKVILVNNNANDSKDVQLSASFLDANNQPLGIVLKNVTILPSQTITVFMDPLKLPAGGIFVGPQGHVDVVAMPFGVSKTVYFYLLSPTVYSPVTKTYTITGVELSNVSLWMDNLAAQLSPVTWQNTLVGIHVVKAANQFVNNFWTGTFQYWNDHIPNNPIAIDVSTNLTITAYYQAEYIGPLPMCAMKVNGTFYVPIMPTSEFKIEMLFDDPNLEGDQAGGISPYDLIPYPDGIVNIKDFTLFGLAFLTCEGQAKWDYMADITADRTVNIKDISLAAKNSGKTGTYITDLTGVKVKFDTSNDEVEPDSDGSVTIPANATSFTVNRNGTAIGSMITFW